MLGIINHEHANTPLPFFFFLPEGAPAWLCGKVNYWIHQARAAQDQLGLSMGKILQNPSFSTGEKRERHEDANCRRDMTEMTEILL